MGTIQYTLEPPEGFSQLQNLYDFLGWNSLKLTVHELEQMCNQSWYAIYAFNEKNGGYGAGYIRWCGYWNYLRSRCAAELSNQGYRQRNVKSNNSTL